MLKSQPKVTCLLKISKVVIKINISIVFPKQHKNHSSIKKKKSILILIGRKRVF
jgi:hypothetical protein